MMIIKGIQRKEIQKLIELCFFPMLVIEIQFQLLKVFHYKLPDELVENSLNFYFLSILFQYLDFDEVIITVPLE